MFIYIDSYFLFNFLFKPIPLKCFMMFDDYTTTITKLLLVKSDATIQIYSNYFNFFNAAYIYTLAVNNVD